MSSALRIALSFAAVVVAVAAGLWLGAAQARDNGQWGSVDPATRAWFQGLRNAQGAICCDTGDGHRVEDPNWRIEADGTYSVLLDGHWQPVPPEMEVKAQNRIGYAVAWMWPPYAPVLRCFMPGASS